MKKRFLALLLAVSMAVSMLAMPAAALGSASNTAVQTSITLGGMDAGQTGSLDAAVTRGAFARMLVAFSAYRESAASQGAVGTLYKDVPGSSQWAPYIRIAVQQGWMNGYTDGTFRPDNAVTLEEAWLQDDRSERCLPGGAAEQGSGTGPAQPAEQGTGPDHEL